LMLFPHPFPSFFLSFFSKISPSPLLARKKSRNKVKRSADPGDPLLSLPLFFFPSLFFAGPSPPSFFLLREIPQDRRKGSKRGSSPAGVLRRRPFSPFTLFFPLFFSFDRFSFFLSSSSLSIASKPKNGCSQEKTAKSWTEFPSSSPSFSPAPLRLFFFSFLSRRSRCLLHG